MLRRLIIPLIALALMGAACSSTTVISEGMLSVPADDGPADVSDAPEPVETVEPVQPESDVRGDRDLGDSTDNSDSAVDGADDDGTEADAESTTDEPNDGDLDFGLGGDDQLGGLVDDCSAGSDMACDILYSTSPVDSPEEELALSCGGRREVTTGFCTDGIESAFGNFWFIESSPGLPAALGSCEDGDMTACDFLYFRSEIGSTYEEVGNTCGGRTAVAIPDCRTVFPS